DESGVSRFQSSNDPPCTMTVPSDKRIIVPASLGAGLVRAVHEPPTGGSSRGALAEFSEACQVVGSVTQLPSSGAVFPPASRLARLGGRTVLAMANVSTAANAGGCSVEAIPNPHKRLRASSGSRLNFDIKVGRRGKELRRRLTMRGPMHCAAAQRERGDLTSRLVSRQGNSRCFDRDRGGRPNMSQRGVITRSAAQALLLCFK